MNTQTKTIKEALSSQGIKASVTELKGSMRGYWNIYNKDLTWWGNVELQNKVKSLGLVGLDGKALSNVSGNGGRFSMPVKWGNK